MASATFFLRVPFVLSAPSLRRAGKDSDKNQPAGTLIPTLSKARKMTFAPWCAPDSQSSRTRMPHAFNARAPPSRGQSCERPVAPPAAANRIFSLPRMGTSPPARIRAACLARIVRQLISSQGPICGAWMHPPAPIVWKKHLCNNNDEIAG